MSNIAPIGPAESPASLLRTTPPAEAAGAAFAEASGSSDSVAGAVRGPDRAELSGREQDAADRADAGGGPEAGSGVGGRIDAVA